MSAVEADNRTLPGSAYHSHAIYELERQAIFHNGWICVGRGEQIQGPGDFRTVDLAGESLILTRDHDRRLRSFFNVCRHRGSRLVDGCGHVTKVFKCPYHAWSYGLTGELRGTPHVSEEEGLSRADHGLWQARVSEWMGFVFVHLGDAGEPASSLLETLADESDGPRELERYGAEELQIGQRIVYDVAANWKIVVENFRECLHCPTVHPELAGLVPLYRDGTVKPGPGEKTRLREGAETLAVGGASGLPHIPGLEPDDHGVYSGSSVFPTLLLNFLSDSALAYILWPRGPERTVVEALFLYPRSSLALCDFQRRSAGIVEFWDRVSREDWAVCERTQLGTASKAFAHGGVFAAKDELTRRFNDDYRRAMAVDLET